MKKKMVLWLAVVVMGIAPMEVLAEGSLEVEQKQVYIYDGRDSGYFFAKVTNSGDAPVAIDEATLVIFSDTDEIILTQEYINSFPTSMMIQPGEYVYLSEFLWDSALENAAIGDTKFSLQTSETGKEITKIPCEVDFALNGADSYDNYIYVTITNETSETVYEYYVVSALTDIDGNVCFVDNQYLETLGVGPNSTVTLKIYVDNDMMNYYEAHQIDPVSADAMVFLVAE